MPQTILIAEDDKHINEVVTEYMKDAGYTVRSYLSGGDALRLIHQITADVDLFILDIMLPEINGLELLKAVRETEEHKEKPVVMLTALTDEATQLISFDEMADDYVTKPFSPKILVKRVQALLRRSVGEGKILRYENIVLNYDSFQAFEEGEKVKLTLREFELLGALMSNAGKVLSRQRLLDYAWGHDYFGDERVVDVHIKNLRKKLKSNVIATIKGVGYRFGEE